MLPSLLFGLNNSLNLTYQLLATNLLSVSVIVILSMSIGFGTARKGWNPDNFIIPLESALSDSLTTLALLFAIVLIP